MAIRLNPGRQKYEPFTGRNVDAMPLLIADNRVPASMANIIDARYEVRNSKDAELKAGWHDNYFDSGDGALYLPNGNLVVAYDAKTLREMTGNSKLVGGALDLKGVDLKDVTGETFTKEQLKAMVIGKDLTLEQAKVHPLWLAFARGDKGRLKNYAEMVFDETKERFGYDTNMGVYLNSTSKAPKMRAWIANRMVGRSGAIGDVDLVDVDGRLVGIASETQK